MYFKYIYIYYLTVIHTYTSRSKIRYSMMLFLSTILNPEHVYIHNISQFKSYVNSRRILLEKRVLMKTISLENKMLLL